MDYIFDLHNSMLKNRLILVYQGEFTQEITKSVLSMAERNLETIKEESGIKRKVFNVMVECLQNIVKHADGEGKEYNNEEAIFIIGKKDDTYIISSGNYIANENVDGLKGKLEQINGLDKDGLKALYKDIIKNGHLSDKGGAGLGFVDMARKSGQKLKFNFNHVNDEVSFFTLQTNIKKQKVA